VSAGPTASRLESTRASDLANAQIEIDVAAWVTAHPLKNANALLTPFAMSTYRLAATAQAEQQEAAAQVATAEVAIHG
jgi:hypothetical protein